MKFQDLKSFYFFLFHVLKIDGDYIGVPIKNNDKGVYFEISNSGSCFFELTIIIFNKEMNFGASFNHELDLDIISSENNMTNFEYLNQIENSQFHLRNLFENYFEYFEYNSPQTENENNI